MPEGASLLLPESRLEDSRKKIRAPFELDPSLCVYSPQANRDALRHPKVAAWLEFVSKEWEPPSDDDSRIALFVPCTKYKPYSTSREHRAINGALLAAGWEPTEPLNIPEGMEECLDPGESLELLNISPLRRGGVFLDRIVMSEPLALVPYQFIYYWQGEQSPATSYDDPGLFEARGTSVSPEREDSTAVQVSKSRWRWGPNEREAFVEVHNFLAKTIAETLERVASRYDILAAWVSPGLTHRSFLADSAFRREDGLASSKRGPAGAMQLYGALDSFSGKVEIMPSHGQLERAKEKLSKRLRHEGRDATEGSVRAVYARGDGNDTPLGLPEALEQLTGWLDDRVRRL
ncbi:MAG: hypothetical protein WEB67_10700 [Acidimicrobiia bacterium]